MNSDSRQSSSSSGSRQHSEGGTGILDTVKDTADRAWEGTKDVAARAWEGTKQAASATAHTLESGVEGVGDMVRRYPLAAALIAIGTGFLIGRCLSMSSRS
jgi:hypothetical protein